MDTCYTTGPWTFHPSSKNLHTVLQTLQHRGQVRGKKQAWNVTLNFNLGPEVHHANLWK